MPGPLRSRRALLAGLGSGVIGVGVLAGSAGCVTPAPPAPAVIRATAPPWDAPRDAVSYVEAAGLVTEPLGTSGNAHVIQLSVTVAGVAVAVPAYIGIDRVRALQAPAHTHEPDGRVWLESSRSVDVTLDQLFALWGVRFADGCLGDACGGVAVRVDGTLVTTTVSLRKVRATVEVTA